MRTLYLLRHAESPMSFDKKDSERPLSDHGHAQAREISKHLKEIDFALCSSATRTRETLEAVMGAIEKPKKIKFSDNLYNAPAQVILDEICNVNAENLLVVAHNPGIHIIANELTQKEATPKHEMLSMTYPPCSLTILECDVEDWALIEKRNNKLIDFITV